MVRRSDLEIKCDVLTTIFEGRGRITHIMYATNTDWVKLKPRLHELVESGLINYKPPLYTITDKGAEAVQAYYRIQRLVP